MARPEKSTLWIVGEVYYPEEISTGYYVTSIAEGLAASRPVRVLTGQPKHMARGTRAPNRETRNGVDITRVWGTTLDKNVLLFRLINMVTIGLSMFFRSLWLFSKGDHVLVVTAPPSLPVTNALACLIKGARYTLLVQDSYPEILIAVGHAKPGSLIVQIANFANQWVYKYASGIITMGRDMTELFRRKTAALDVPIHTIPNWADVDAIHPMQRQDNSLLKELSLTEKFVFLYAGNIGHPSDVETIVGAAELLLDTDVFHFLFIGAGSKKAWLEEQRKIRGLTNFSIIDYRPRSEQNVFLNACDVGLVALIQGMWGTAMPSRTYNLMAAGKPILALTDEGSELALVIDEEGIGWHLPPGDPAALAGVIIKAFSEREKFAAMADAVRAAAVSKYSPAAALRAYDEALP